MYYQLTDAMVVPADADATWQFFSRAENLPQITPPWMRFSIATPTPIALQQDYTIDYTIRWLNLPVRWRTRIIDWTPPRQFIDLQIRGPYTLWHHQHTFEPNSNGSGTVCRDRVLYKLPAGLVGRAVNAMLVRRQLMEIFQFRRQAISQHLGPTTPLQPHINIQPLQ